MLSQLAYLRERMETSIWLIPLGMCLLALPLAVVSIWLDRTLPAGVAGLGGFGLDVGSARHVLGVIAGSVISVGGVGFSVTMVALTLTSGQYGPKILRNFLEDNTSKVSLGMFLGTFIYALVALIGQPPEGKLQITVLTALLLSLAALLAFIQFIHRTATDLQADQIVQRIGGQLQQALCEEIANADADHRMSDTLPWRRATRSKRGIPVAARDEGYVQSVDIEALRHWCDKHDCQLLVRVRAGDFMVPGLCIAQLYGIDGDPVEAALDSIHEAIVTGPIRTPAQDPEHAVTQLNQLAARALSPGINDPGTAITCIDWFSLALGYAVDKDLPGSVVCDDDGTPRLLVRARRFAPLLKSAFAPLRQYARGNVPVVIRLITSLCRLAELTHRRDRLDALAHHGDLIWAEARTAGLNADDLNDVRQRHARLHRLALPPTPY